MTAAAALETARAYVADNRPFAQVALLHEDAQDFYVELELREGFTEWPRGAEALFIDKRSGKIRTVPWGEWVDRIDDMTPVTV